jgi:hypothetical protein
MMEQWYFELQIDVLRTIGTLVCAVATAGFWRRDAGRGVELRSDQSMFRQKLEDDRTSPLIAARLWLEIG